MSATMMLPVHKQRKGWPPYNYSARILSYFLSFAILSLLGFHRSGEELAPTPLENKLQTFGRKNAFDAKLNATVMSHLPSLGSLVNAKKGEIIGDISWMLDFAVVAFPKSGTTFMKDYLNKSNETFVYERELCMKQWSDVPQFVEKFYAEHIKSKQSLDSEKEIQFGLKCPGVLYRKHDLNIYREYFPKTKFIIGLRHPVSWFESFYNYQSYRNLSLPPTTQLIGRCGTETDHKVCTDRARFHAALARFGKTPINTEEELSLLFGLRNDQHGQRKMQQNVSKINPQHRDLAKKDHNIREIPNKIYLYEVRQVTVDASKDLPSELRQYLGINQNFPEIIPFKQNKTRTIDICDEEHDEVRKILVEHGSDAAHWIRNYFIKNPTVQVASPESFHQFLDDWRLDPCLGRSQLTQK